MTPTGNTATIGSQVGKRTTIAARATSLNPMWCTVLLSLLLVALSVMSFGRCLSCYFLADDLLFVSCLHSVFHNGMTAVLADLLSPWQGNSVQLFWRPCAEMSLIMDYAIYHSSAFGFHATNLAVHSAVSVLLFLVGKRLLAIVQHPGCTIAAFVAAALFCSDPINSETVIWIVGRVDSLCAMFSLLSFYCFMQGRSSNRPRRYQVLSLLFFLLALGSKETAVVLPLVFAAYLLSTGNESRAVGAMPCIARATPAVRRNFCKWIPAAFSNSAAHPQVARVRALAAKINPCLPFFLTALAYLIARACVLGELIGGYRGSYGEAYLALPWHYPLTNGNLWKLFYPFNEDLVGSGDLLPKLLHVVYLLAGLFLLCLSTRRRSISNATASVLTFGTAWFALAFAPAWKLAIIQPTLAGGRFAYIPLLAACLLVSTALFAVAQPGKYLMALRTAIVVAMLVIFSAIDRLNIDAWLESSRQLQALQRSLVQAVAGLPERSKVILLNTPTSFHGAHACYRDDMLASLLTPPLTSAHIADRVLSLQLHNNGELLNCALLRRLSGNPPTSRIVAWDAKRLSLQPVPASSIVERQFTAPKSISHATTAAHSQDGAISRTVATFAPPLDTACCGILQIQATCTSSALYNKPALVSTTLRWNNGSGIGFKEPRQTSLALHCDGKAHTYGVCLDQLKSWLLAQSVSRVSLDVPANYCRVLVHSVLPLPQRALVPRLQPSNINCPQLADGTLIVGSSPCLFNADASGIVGAAGIIVEVSKPTSFFEHYSGCLRDTATCRQSLLAFRLKAASGAFSLSSNELKKPAIYQVRVFALDEDQNIISFASDPVQVVRQ